MIRVIGTGHHLVPPSQLEEAIAAREQLVARLLRWQSAGRIAGAILVTTCNRLEVVLDGDVDPIMAADLFGDLPHHDHRDRAATHYLLRVATGLDSLVRGEDQILGQLREAFKHADRHGLLNARLRVMRNQLVAAARDVRQRTGISETRVSVAALAARRLECAGRNLVVVGAGETGRLAVETLVKRGQSRVLIVNRTLTKAQALADHFGIEALALRDFLAGADTWVESEWDGILIAVHSSRPLIQAKHLRGMNLVIDISMPGVLDSTARALTDVEILDLDSIASLVQVEGDRRATALATAEELVRGQAGSVHRTIEETGTRAHLAGIVDQHIETAMQELQSELDTKLRHLSAADQEQIRRAVLRATRRNAHQYVKDLRECSGT